MAWVLTVEQYQSLKTGKTVTREYRKQHPEAQTTVTARNLDGSWLKDLNVRTEVVSTMQVGTGQKRHHYRFTVTFRLATTF